MNLRQSVRTLALASLLAAGVSTSAVAIRPAAAEPIQWTGPQGRQCHPQSQSGGDFVDPENDDATNDAVSALNPAPGGGSGPQITIGGCSLTPPVHVVPPTHVVNRGR